MRVRVDIDRCQGHAQCALAAPEVFQVDDEDGRAYAVSEEVAIELEPSVQKAAGRCPERAVVIS